MICTRFYARRGFLLSSINLFVPQCLSNVAKTLPEPLVVSSHESYKNDDYSKGQPSGPEQTLLRIDISYVRSIHTEEARNKAQR